jgi:hypothetical protein
VQRDQEVLPEKEVHLDHRVAHRVGPEEHDRDEVVVVLDLRPLAELGRVLEGDRVDGEHVAQQRDRLLAGVVQVQPEDVVVVQRLLDVIRLEVVVGAAVDPDQVPVHTMHGVRPAR